MKQNYKLNQFTQEIEREMKQESFKNQYYYENEYLIKHNQICPLCKGKIKKNFKNILTGTNVIGIINLEKQRTSISYTLCKKCSKEIANASDWQKINYEKKISSHVLDTITIG